MTDTPSDLTDHITQAALSNNPTALVNAIIEAATESHFTSLVHGVEEAYEQDPTATTATLAHALKLANEEGAAEAAAQATVAALIAGGKA
jgi:hypothetical protein